MVATLAKAATADYYVHSQASFRPPEDYYLSGEEPDGIWWNPSALFAGDEGTIADGETLDSADFYKLYRGVHPRTGEPLVRNAGSDKRCPAYDLTFNADKTVSALWAIAPPEFRSRIEDAHNDAVRVALEDTIQKHCSYTRIANPDRTIKIVPADIMAALFQHGASRANDPHLHTHCVILNVAKAHHDGKYRALHGKPLYAWQKAAGAAYRAELGYLLRTRLGIELETHGDEEEFTRVRNIPQDLIGEWSKRDQQIIETAAKFGVSLNGNGAFHGAVQRATRAPKEHGVDPEIRHDHWIREASGHVEDLDVFIDSATGHEFRFTEEDQEALDRKLAALPQKMTEMESVFRYTQVYEKAANAAAGMLPREERQRVLDRVLASEEFIELDKPKLDYDGGARLAHTRTFTAAHTLQTEKDIHDLAADLVGTGGFALPQSAVQDKIEALETAGYPTSPEQSKAMNAATRAGQIAIIEGAAGSGKTTTLRPIADLYRARGYEIVATAVPWEVSLELGSDLNAYNRCVDKLVAEANSGKLKLSPKSVIFVDEAGMLSSNQALKILRIARNSGAKLVFAGDTQQQQPVEAGPGLRLIRDLAGSARVDTIRRQKPDAEDVLIAVHGRHPEAARRLANAATDRQREEVLEEFEALPDRIKPDIRPWQVAASENFRDGRADTAIAAYHARERFHIHRDLERTLDRVVEDWDDFRTRHPDKSSAVIAMTNAECRALSHLMRERVLKNYDGPRYTIRACRSRNPKARPEPLELAVGDVLRAGALIWDKQIFNGTYMTVTALERHGTVPGAGDEPRIHITARTNRGEIVEFHHDEMRDYEGNIRINHGYTMTMTSAQGRTVDRAFLLADQKPARETIYPACTRHRERLDIYVNRKPIELDIRQQRNEETAGDPVTDAEIREYLARSWSRERPKEAAKDYMSEDMRTRHFGAGEASSPASDRPVQHPPPSQRTDPRGRTPSQWLTANDAGDGKLADIAARIRYSEIRVRHGLAAEGLGRACNKLTDSLRQWDRDRADKGNAAVAMDPAFRRDLGESAAILRTMTPFIEGNPLHARLLREHGGIDVSDLKAFANSHTRALSIFQMSRSERREADPAYRAAAHPNDPMEAFFANAERLIAGLEPEPDRQETLARAPAAPTAAPDPPHDPDAYFDAVPGPDGHFDWEPDYDAEWQPPDVPDIDPLRGPEITEEHVPGETHPPERDIPPPFDPGPEYNPDDDVQPAVGDRFAPGIDPGMPAGPEPEPPPLAQGPDAPAAPSPPSPADLIIDHSVRLDRHCDDAAAADMHPFDAPGWAALEAELRDFLGLAGLQPALRQYVEDELRNIDAVHDARRETETHHAEHADRRHPRAETPRGPSARTPADPRPETGPGIGREGLTAGQEPDPLPAPPAAPPSPSPRELIDEHALRLRGHYDNADAIDMNAFDAPGWDGLEKELRGFLGLAGLQPADRQYVEDQIRGIDALLDARRQAEALYAEHVERSRPHMETPTDPSALSASNREILNRITQEALSIAENPALPDTSRLELLAVHNPKRYIQIVDRRAAVEAQSPAAVQQRQQHAQDLYDRHIDRQRAYTADVLDPSTPTTIASPLRQELRREAEDLLQNPDLPEPARLDLLRTYQPAQHRFMLRPQDQPGRLDGPDAPRFTDRPDSYGDLRNDIENHLTDARRVGRHPYEAPGWSELAGRCHRLLQSGTLSAEQRAQLGKLAEHHRAWQASHNQQPTLFQDNPGPSPGRGF